MDKPQSTSQRNATWRDRMRRAGLTQKLIWVSPDEWLVVKGLIDKLRKLRSMKDEK